GGNDRRGVGRLCSRVRVEEKRLRGALVRRGIDVVCIDDREVVMELGRPWRNWDVVLERSLSQTRALAALRVLDAWRVPSVNTLAVTALSNDKLAATSVLEAAGIAVPRTAVAFTPESALRAAEEI